jgi:hypothetical protein
MGQGLVQISSPAKPGGPAGEPEPKQTEIAKDITSPGADNHAIFVGGTGRSGTTLLINLLGSHPQIASTVTETKLIGHDIFRDFPKILHGLPMNQRKDAVEKYKHIWVNQFYKFKIKPMRPDDDGFRGLYVWLPMEFLQESLPILDKAIKAKTLDEICLVHGEFMNSFMMKYAKSKNKIHWAEKTPLNGQYSHMYYKWFPNLRAVNIVRDARDVAMSHQNVTWGIKDHIQAIDWWGQTMKAIMEAVRQTPQRNCLTIRYEDLVTRPEMIKCRLLRFLDLPENPDDFNFEIRTSSVGYWREKLPKHAADYAVQKYGNLLKYLGYQVD